MLRLLHLPQSLRARILLFFSALFVATLAAIMATMMFGLPVGDRPGYIDEALTQELRHLETTADLEKRLLEGWLRERRGDMSVLASEPDIQRFLAWYRMTRPDVQELLRAPLQQEVTAHLESRRHAYLAYTALALVDARTGQVLAAAGEEVAGRAMGNVAPALLEKATEPGIEEFIDMVDQGRRLVIGRQVLDANGEVVALVFSTVDTDATLSPLLSQRDIGRVGSSEESLLVSENRTLLTTLRHPLANGTPAEPFYTRLDTEPVRLSTSGHEGAIRTLDYRHVPVLAAYRHVTISPDVGWGLIVKQDESEVLAPLRRSVTHFLLVGLLGLGFLLAGTLVAAHALARPIRSLVEAARRIEQGDLGARARILGGGELAALTATFNTMAARVQAWHDELERELALRTHALEEERNAAQRYMDVAGVILLVVRADQTIGLINRMGCTTLGYAEQELVGRNWFDTCLPEEDRERVRAYFLDILAGRATLVDNYENHVLTRSGERRLIAWRATLLRDAQGTPIGTLSSGDDITERRQVEEALERERESLRLAQRIARLGNWEWDIPAGTLSWSDEVYHIFGFTPQAFPATYEAFLATIHPDDREQVTQEVEAALTQARPYSADHRIILPDGSQRLVHEEGEVQFDAEGHPLRMNGTVQDVTEQRQVEAALKQLNENLEKRVADEVEKNREKDHLMIQQSRLAAMGEMIGNIAHQWRQPLNALGLVLANIKDAYDFNELSPDALGRQLGTARRLIERMSTTIDDFRNFFRPDRQRTTFFPRESVTMALALVDASFRHDNITATLKEEQPVLVEGFPNEFSQVVLNVLANAKEAIQAHHVAEGRISVEIGGDEQEAWVRIGDNGGGIPTNVLPKIFDPYFTTKEKGTGIGLYMSRMIVENMGGTLEAGNSEEGAVFTIRLPRQGKERAEAEV